ncbi:MAG: VWA domain-containing protein [Clostridia bacterium]|nr:VWA domain-containing protein [Clostridia bacterium]
MENGENCQNSRKAKNTIVAVLLLLAVMIITVLTVCKGNVANLPQVAKSMFNVNAGEIASGPNEEGQAIESISMETEGYAEDNGVPGSWHLDKSAEWTDIDKARITFDVNNIRKRKQGTYKDVLLVLDISGSMEGRKLEKVQNDSVELVEYLLSDSNNKVGLIVYNDGAETITNFTNNRAQLVNKINSMTASGCTNYNDPLKHVDAIMRNYTKQEDREVVTLFLTDGYPNVDTPNQVGTYQMLKSKYTYMPINGIQYEMGASMTQEIIDISDNQWVASMYTLNNVLFKAAGCLVTYDTFQIEDVINNEYFVVGTVEDIEVSMGTVRLIEENETQKIVWSLDNQDTGFDAQMIVNVTLKGEYKYVTGYYPTNKETKVTYKEKLTPEETQQTAETPILKMQPYTVTYESNTPEGGNVVGIPNAENYYPFESVTKAQVEPICEGWNFRGWEIVTENVTSINEDVFVMPTENVILRAIWGKQGITKSMRGRIATITLPKVGDTVYYSPSGTYTWDATYATSSSITKTVLSSQEGGSFRITEWKVLSVDEESGNVEIVPAEASISTRNVRFQGAQGYNNAVYLLNEACSKLYSDASKGITARSINEDDFIKAGKREKATDTEQENALVRFRRQYSVYNVLYGNQVGSSYTTYRYYPILYASEKNSVINGVKNTTGLGQNEQTKLIGRTESGGTSGYKQASSSLRPYQSWYISKDYPTTQGLLENDKAAVLLPNGEGTYYWMASRCILTFTQDCSYYVRYVHAGHMHAARLFGSYIESGSDTDSRGIFPVVSLNLDLLDETDAEGVYVVD